MRYHILLNVHCAMDLAKREHGIIEAEDDHNRDQPLQEYWSAVSPLLWERAKCDICQKSCLFYCYRCYRPVGVPKSAGIAPPSITLPFKLDIIFMDSPKKATGIHAKIVAEEDCSLWEVRRNEIPEFDAATTCVMYPSVDASPFNDLTDSELGHIKSLIFIDCPWGETQKFLRDPKISQLRKIKLHRPPKLSRFWRYHSAGEGCISTIEAIYYAVREYSDVVRQRLGTRAVDEDKQSQRSAQDFVNHLTPSKLPSHPEDLLYYFILQYKYIQGQYMATADRGADYVSLATATGVHEAVPRNAGTDVERDVEGRSRVLPMDEAAKEKQRKRRSQKEKGKLLKQQHREAKKAARHAKAQSVVEL